MRPQSADLGKNTPQHNVHHMSYRADIPRRSRSAELATDESVILVDLCDQEAHVILSEFERQISHICYEDHIPGWFRDLMQNSRKDALVGPGRGQKSLNKRLEIYPEDRIKLPEESKVQQLE